MSTESKPVFELSLAESRESLATVALVLGWLFLGALIVSTGIHAVSLVVQYTRQQTGFMYAVRVGSPILTEIFAALVAIGFAVHIWRSRQKLLGVVVEVIWFVFASLNLLVSFTTESGGTLPNTLAFWLHYGLPVSALITGTLFYIMYRLDPVHRRMAEYKAADERDEMAMFTARRSVRNSPQMDAIRKQQAWLQEIVLLESEGYTDKQIAFMLSAVPELKQLALSYQKNHDGFFPKGWERLLNVRALADVLASFADDEDEEE